MIRNYFLIVRKPFLIIFSLCLLFFIAVPSIRAFTFPQIHKRPLPITWRRHKAVCANASGKMQAGCNAQVVLDSNSKVITNTVPSGYGPLQFHTAYNLPVNALLGNPIIAIVDAYDDPNVYSDLNKYSDTFGIPRLTECSGSINSFSGPCFKKVNQNGGTGLPSANASWALEISLDVEASHAICQNCKLLLVETNSNSMNNLMKGIDQAVAQGAVAISNSWSGSEFGSESFYDSHLNHPGVAITAASGDSGYGGGTQYPASSPYVVSVGGTTLQINSDNTYYQESVWNGSGSGCSLYESKSSWQTDNCQNRTENDVAADADPSTGAAVYDTYSYSGQTGWFQVGGTSLATPIIAATFALAGVTPSVQEASLLYQNPLDFYDVTTGNNGTCGSYLCQGIAGFDGPTGLGSPNGLSGFVGLTGATPTPTPIPTITSTPTLTPTPTTIPTPTITPTPTIQPLSIGITSPKDGSTLRRGSRVTITTTVSANVSQVQFFVNDARVCTDTRTPFTCNWRVPNTSGKQYVVKVEGFDKAGNSTSDSITVNSSNSFSRRSQSSSPIAQFLQGLFG